VVEVLVARLSRLVRQRWRWSPPPCGAARWAAAAG